MQLRRFDDAVIWSGFARGRYHKGSPPRLCVTVRLHYWSLPLSLTLNGHLISRRGFCVGVGPIYFSWSWA